MDSEKKVNVEVNETQQTGPSWFNSEDKFKEMLNNLYNIKVA